MGYLLTFKNGCCWHLVAGSPQAEAYVTRMAATLQLHDGSPATARKIQISFQSPGIIRFDSDGFLCQSDPLDGSNAFYPTLIQFTLALARDAQPGACLFLHCALAVHHDGQSAPLGVILAGPSDRGKTTASRRLSPPWYSLSDDYTFVVRDNDGNWWAHPWPTWSQFKNVDCNNSWNVQQAVRLEAIFYLKQAISEQATAVGKGQSTALLVQSASQAWHGMTLDMSPEEWRSFNLQRFDLLSDLARSVPGFILDLSLTGQFWESIEHVLKQ